MKTRFTLQNVNLRKDVYIIWANHDNVTYLFNETVERSFDILSRKCIPSSESDEETDLLYVMLKEEDLLDKPTGIVEKEIHVELNALDYPLFRPVLLPSEILTSKKRNYASSAFNTIGVQHLTKPAFTDSNPSSRASSRASSKEPTSASSSSLDEPTDMEDSSTSNPIKSILTKTCQLATQADCQGLLSTHQKNSTPLIGTHTKVWILVYCNSSELELYRKISKSLGVIFIDDIIEQAGVNAKNDEILERLSHTDSKLYRMLQTRINQQLILGKNNFCVTSNADIFLTIKANVRGMIHCGEQDAVYDVTKPYCNFTIEIDQICYLKLVAAVAEIVNFSLNCETHLFGTYYKTDCNDTTIYFKIKVPIIPIIPMYIIDYFVQKYYKNPKNKSHIRSLNGVINNSR